MSNRIKILHGSLVSKIAAGEVIQRPASAVKELIENSIDAEAKSISIIIEDGGKNLIQVVDDGTGMTHDDALIAFERHATSKISTYDDLENVMTLGFRGEALASIAAVAQIEMVSRISTEETAVKVKISHVNRLESFPCAGQVGTSVTVRNLFYNTPGRKKFLKSTPTEFKHVIEVIQRMAVSYPEIAWKFISENEIILNLRPADLRERIADIFGERIASALLPVEDKNEFMRLRGFISPPDFSRKTRAEQFLFLNGRFIVNRNINHAVFRGYENLLLKGTFPVFMLFIEINPQSVDVNVHPTKLDVKFADEGSIYRFVAASVRRVISAGDILSAVLHDNMEERRGDLNVSRSAQTMGGSAEQPKWNRFLGTNEKTGFYPAGKNNGKLFDSERLIKKSDAGSVSDDKEQGPENLNATQLFNKYILTITEDGFYLIDQHAAHERILYEQAVERIANQKMEIQELLFPQMLQMNAADVALVKELLPYLNNLGFSLKLFSSSTIIIDGVPLEIKPGRERTILQEIIDLFREDEHGTHVEPYDRLAKSYACKAAIKTGDPLKTSEMYALLQQLFSCKIPFSCPHGRPVALKYTIKELDRRFGRTS